MSNIIRNTTRVLRGVLVFRLLLIALGVLFFLVWRPTALGEMPAAYPMHAVLLVPTLLTSVLLLVPGLQKPLGRYYLPVALVLTILDLSLQYAIAYLRPSGVGYVMVTLANGRELRFFWASTETVLLVLVPCILAATAYGLRGGVLASSLAAFLHLALGIAIWQSGLPLEGYAIFLPVRIGVLYAFPMIAGAMADTWRREHVALQGANRDLRGYAVAVEHLATSRERVRLARAMHDTLAHSLAALVVQLEALDTLQETNPAAAPAQLDRIRDHARVGLDEARRAILDLRSAPVEELGLPAAMEHAVETFGRRSGTQTHWRVVGTPVPLLPVQANALYRILEEALHNVEQHAQAQSLVVTLDYSHGVALTIRDDGRGFDPSDVEPDRLGLVGIRERATLIDGQVRVETGEGQGTALVVDIAAPWR